MLNLFLKMFLIDRVKALILLYTYIATPLLFLQSLDFLILYSFLRNIYMLGIVFILFSYFLL